MSAARESMASATGKSLTAWQTDTKPVLAEGTWKGVVLDLPRAELYDRCDARLGSMVKHGALDEVRVSGRVLIRHPSVGGGHPRRNDTSCMKRSISSVRPTS